MGFVSGINTIDISGKITAYVRMLKITHLLDLADRYQAVEFCADKTLSNRLFSDTKKLSALRNGADITVSRFNDAVLWFSHNWPDKAAWPDNIMRPCTDEVVQ